MSNPLLPQLDRAIMRPQEELEASEKEIWQPKWKCYCCGDSGVVKSHLARLVIQGFDLDRDLLPLCQNEDCEKADWMWGLQGSIDNRFSPAVCQRLDLIEREAWKESVIERREAILRRMQQLSDSKSLRLKVRDAEEERSARQKHEENRLMTPQEQGELQEAWR